VSGRARRICGTMARRPARRSHVGGFQMSQAALIELVNLSSMHLKANKVSLVAIGTHSERPIELLTSSRRVDRSDDFTDNAQVRSLLVVRGVFPAC
jgi:hypothetical protein